MNYPLISEYIEAIKSAEENFDNLCHLRPVMKDNGEPVMSAGGFSVVFKMKDVRDGKLYAVKCFTKEQKERAERYRLITKELELVSSNHIIAVKYLEHELFVDSKTSDEDEQPVLLMDWVEGISLDLYIQENFNNRFAISRLTLKFCKMAAWLLTQPFAHGDLKLDNILVKNGELVLVDYDGMFVPTMEGRYIANEVGSPGFRHPLRTANLFDKHIDDFTLASIALSLDAIAYQPSLYSVFGGNDRLLFSENDFKNLYNSDCIKALQPLMRYSEFCNLYGIFLIAWSNMKLFPTANELINIGNIISRHGSTLTLLFGYDDYDIAVNYIKEHEYEKAFNLLSEYATIDESDIGCMDTEVIALSQNGLAYMYANGLGIERDYCQAINWFKKATNNGGKEAIFNLGICYHNGWGVEKNIKKANYYFHLAALQNYGPAIELETWVICDPTYTQISAKEEEAMNLQYQKELTSKFVL